MGCLVLSGSPPWLEAADRGVMETYGSSVGGKGWQLFVIKMLRYHYTTKLGKNQNV